VKLGVPKHDMNQHCMLALFTLVEETFPRITNDSRYILARGFGNKIYSCTERNFIVSVVSDWAKQNVTTKS
jgi:hypothetical protein